MFTRSTLVAFAVFTICLLAYLAALVAVPGFIESWSSVPLLAGMGAAICFIFWRNMRSRPRFQAVVVLMLVISLLASAAISAFAWNYLRGGS